MVRPILQLGDPKLKLVCKPVNNINVPSIKRAIKDMVDTMKAKDLIGLAAPQIGVNLKLFVTQPRKTKHRSALYADKLRVYINPSITKFSNDKVTIYEGCGCVANGTLFGPVIRPSTISVHARNDKGKDFQLQCDGILSRVIQHEYDHLSGVEFIEKISDYRLLVNVDFYRKHIKNSLQQKKPSKITLLNYSER